MKYLLMIFKYHLRLIYFFIKCSTRQRKQIFFLSRQTNEPSLNYKLLIEYIEKKDSSLKIKVSCGRVSDGLNKLIHKNDGKTDIKFIFKEIGKMIAYYFLLYKQMYYIATSKVVITDGYNVLISTLNHKKGTKVIQMWHALAAIKQFGFQSVNRKDGLNTKTAKVLDMHKNYDYILSGSEAMCKPFSEAFSTPIEKILPIGTPYIDYLLKKKVDRKKIYAKYPYLKEKPIILYSPTFRKNGRDVIKEVIDSVDLKKYNLVITLHALDKEKAEKHVKEGVLLNPDIEYASLLSIADYVITDYSALMIEAAILKTNILLYVYDYEEYKEENGLNINLFEELPGYVSKNIKDLIKIIETKSYNKKILLDFRKKYITNIDGTSTEKIYRLIRECCK